MTTKARRLIEK